MAHEIADDMPDEESNIQLGEGAVPAKQLLGGDVTTVFSYRPDQTGFEHALAAVKADQEMMCGYELTVASTKQTEMSDAEGRVNEVYVTFSPAAGDQ